MSKSKELSSKPRLVVYGSQKEIDAAEAILTKYYLSPSNSPHKRLDEQGEAEARLALQNLIDEHKIKAHVLYDGNNVYSKRVILRDIRRVKNHGMLSMTNELYRFLSLACGSIAHFNKYGWIQEYPTIEHLKAFFRRNEFGHRVLDHVPRWKTDVIAIVKEIEKELGIV